jgi:dihydrofolate reductase
MLVGGGDVGLVDERGVDLPRAHGGDAGRRLGVAGRLRRRPQRDRRHPLGDGGERLHSALDQARAVAGDKDVAIGGGANIVRQCLAVGVIDEIRLRLVPVLLGDGVRLFDDAIKAPMEELALTSVDQADGVVHLRYRVRR